MNERVVLIGLDGGEPRLLERLLPECPNLARVAADGVWGRLRSPRPPLSPPAWASLMTGTNPGKHGVFDFYHMALRAQGSYVRRLVTSANWRAPALWDFCAAGGRRAGFVNMPMCYPPPRSADFFVCGLGTPGAESAYAHPATLVHELGDVVLEPGDGAAMGDPAAFLARSERAGRDMLAVAERLWRTHALDLFCAALTFPDRFQHVFWPALDGGGDAALLDRYVAWLRAFDAFLGRVLDAAAAAGTTVVVFSDHGFGPVRRYFHPNRWLAAQGHLAIGDPGRFGSPDGLLTAIDWTRTRAVSLGEYGEVRLNLRGRDPLGTVEPGAEAERLAAEIADALRALRDDDGAPVVAEVTPAAAVYHGPHVGEAADLLFRLADERDLCWIDGRGRDLRDAGGPLLEPAVRPAHYRGAHRRDGLLAAVGPGVRRTAGAVTAAAEDLCPTVLHLLGLPLDPAIDGRVLGEMLAPSVAARPLVYAAGVAAEHAAATAAYDAAEEAHVRAQLAQLGYVE
jgi:predicted AlkP superfamily phosphohydrolase/phosphomutase